MTILLPTHNRCKNCTIKIDEHFDYCSDHCKMRHKEGILPLSALNYDPEYENMDELPIGPYRDKTVEACEVLRRAFGKKRFLRSPEIKEMLKCYDISRGTFRKALKIMRGFSKRRGSYTQWILPPE